MQVLHVSGDDYSVVWHGVVFGNIFSTVATRFFDKPVNFISIPSEEKWMDETFGQDYQDCQIKVRR